MVTKPWCMEAAVSNLAPFALPTVSRASKRRILNASTLKALAPPPTGSVDHFDDLTPGLSLRITSNDVRTWTVFFRDKTGRQKRLTLGRYPAVTLADARELAREAQRKVAKGGDPVAEKRAAREVLSFAELAERYIEDHAKPNKRSWAEDQRQLEANLLPKWKNRPAAEVTAEDLLIVLNAKVRAGAPVAANRGTRACVAHLHLWGRPAARAAQRESGARRQEAHKRDDAGSRVDGRRDSSPVGGVCHTKPLRQCVVPTAARNSAAGRRVAANAMAGHRCTIAFLDHSCGIREERPWTPGISERDRPRTSSGRCRATIGRCGSSPNHSWVTTNTSAGGWRSALVPTSSRSRRHPVRPVTAPTFAAMIFAAQRRV